jgi:hypothetical protein
VQTSLHSYFISLDTQMLFFNASKMTNIFTKRLRKTTESAFLPLITLDILTNKIGKFADYCNINVIFPLFVCNPFRFILCLTSITRGYNNLFKRILAVLMLFTLVATIAPSLDKAAASGQTYNVNINFGFLNVRKNPSASGAIITKLAKGQQITVTSL